MQILLFGITKDIVGQSQLTLPEGETVGNVSQLKTWLCKQYPEFNNLSSLAIAVNSEYADDDTLIDSQSEVALIPPVSGG
ncbi:molybdopterin converting factor subunit 1 [Mucilaginibacter ginkgonis]|uniref:Molybdopterin synthase sulfur carrier subunit n=1 Tax=Mucilaginibacter ginkgonis TaxID=2682091 RepID=A0A6I4I3D9_9SPHI|nr:molybdopterin converting factor subunit 1 [Mucilaginibacter ginkgonis]QQL50737.1 molybdopterin converting factor subunit 1 [Mucilaginibacter ginkgonis]